MKIYMLRNKKTKLYYKNAPRNHWVDFEHGQLYKSKSGAKSSVVGYLYDEISDLPGCPDPCKNFQEFRKFHDKNSYRIFNERFEIVEFELVEK